MGDENKYLKNAIISIVVIVVLIVGYGIYINSASRVHVDKMLHAEYARVTVDKVQYKEIHATLGDLTIAVKSKWMVDIQAQLEGTIKEVYVKQGDKVKAGQALLLLENPDLPAQIVQADGSIIAAEATLLDSSKSLERFRKLAMLDGIPQQQYDDAIAAYDTAVGTLKTKKAQKEALMVSQGKSVIRAPQDADVLRIYRHEGDYIRPGEAAVLVGDLSKLNFRTMLPEAELQKILPIEGEFSLQLGIYQLQYKTYPLNLETHPLERKSIVRAIAVAPELTTKASYRYVDWSIENGMGLLEPTTYHGVKIIAQQGRRVLAIPRQALSDNLDPQVFILGNDNILELRSIKIGSCDDRYVEVREGLSENDVIVISDRRGLKVGTRVRGHYE